MSDTAKPTGTIYDLGYKRYVGTRRSQATRWRVIARHTLAQAWKKWWRYKVWMVLAIMTTVTLAAIMILMRSEKLGEVRNVEPLTRLVDGLVFGSIIFFTQWGFLLTLTMGTRVVASDLRTGAFTFYFARPVRPVDYIIGKSVALLVLQATLLLAPLLILTFVRLGLSENTDELIRNLSYPPKALLIGFLAASTYASLSLGFSAMLGKPALNVAMWAGFYLILSTIISKIAAHGGYTALACIDPSYALGSLSFELFNVTSPLFDQMYGASLEASVISLAGFSALGIGIAYLRVNAAAHLGIGGGS